MTTVEHPAQDASWYNLSPEDAATRMGVDPEQGLASEEVQRAESVLDVDGLVQAAARQAAEERFEFPAVTASAAAYGTAGGGAASRSSGGRTIGPA